MTNNPIFQQLNNMQNGNMNSAMYKAQLKRQLDKMQANNVNGDQIINQGISSGQINQQQANWAYGIARNIAKNLFGITE